MTDELTLSLVFIERHHRDAARILDQLPDERTAALLEAMPAAIAARALGAMLPTSGARCLQRMAPDHAAATLVELPARYAASLLRRLDPASTSAIMTALPEDETRLLGAMLTYPPGSAGFLMDSRVFAATAHMRVGDALTALRRLPPQLHDSVFVVDDEHRLMGAIGLRELLSARRHRPIAEVMNREVSRLPASAPRAAILNHPGWRLAHTLPVVDDTNLLVGAIAHSTVRAIFEEDALGRLPRADAVTTVVALGELYWLGLSGVLDGVVSAVGRAAPASRHTQEVDHHGRH